VAQVVEAERAKAGSRQRLLVAPTKCGAVEVAAEVAGEHQVVVADPVLAPA